MEPSPFSFQKQNRKSQSPMRDLDGPSKPATTSSGSRLSIGSILPDTPMTQHHPGM
ncbi:MAG: hypothetical protein JOZ18_18170 [Chloroflexi bacterium]|nr:hypothetical protein [Chloroflexota bacterium]